MEAVFQILKNFPKGFITGLLMNGSVIVLAYLVFWKKFKTRFGKFRIQLLERVDEKQIKKEIKNSVQTLMVGALFSSIVLFLSTKGYTKIYTNFGDHHPIFGIAGFFILLIIDDAWFYFTHRLLHHPWIFRYVHAVHHQSIDVNPFTSMSFHWIEPFLPSFWIFPVAFIMPTFAPMLALVQVWGLLDNVKAHLGYEFYPVNFNKSWLRFLTTSTHHNLHHSRFKGNYSVHFRFWDRVFGTEIKDYETEFDKIQNRKQSVYSELVSCREDARVSGGLVHFNGTHPITVYEGETILEALIRHGLAVPYSCRKGICATCKCRLTIGQVTVSKTNALTEHEVRDGFILICQSLPESPHFKIFIR